MSLTPGTITRTNEVGGDAIRTFSDGAAKSQAVALIDDIGGQMGVSSNPIYAIMKGLGFTSNAESGNIIGVFGETFERWVNNRTMTLELLNAGIGTTNPSITRASGGGLKLTAGDGSGAKVALRSRFAAPYIPGIGITIGFALKLTDVASGITNQITRFGIGDNINGINIEWSGTTSKVRLSAIRGGSESLSVDGDDWDTPVLYDGGAGLLKETIQHWVISYDYMTNRISIYLDGAIVHQITATVATPYMYHPSGRLMVEVENTAGTSNSNDTYVYGVYVLHSNRHGLFFQGLKRRFAFFNGVSVTDGADRNIFGLHFAPYKQLPDAQHFSRRAARIRRIELFAMNDTATGSDSQHGLYAYLLKNPYLVGSTLTWNHEASVAPDTAWTGITTPITVAASVTSSTGSGYSAGQNVEYKVSALGPYGETVPSTASSSTSVGTPAKKMTVTIKTPIPHALAYNIYRQVGGAGGFKFVATVDVVTMEEYGFTDNAYTASSASPAGSTSTDHDSFMETYESPSTVQGGTKIRGLFANVASPAVIQFADGELVLHPGETLALVIPNANLRVNSVVSAYVAWDEEG